MIKFTESKLAWIAAYIGAYSYAAPDPYAHWGFAALSFFAAQAVALLAYDPGERFKEKGRRASKWIMTTLIVLAWAFGLYNHENLNLFRAGAWAALTTGVVLLIGFIWRLISGYAAATAPPAIPRQPFTFRQALVGGPLLGLLAGGLLFADAFFVIWVADLFGVALRFDPPWFLYVAAAAAGLGWGLMEARGSSR